MSVCRYYDETKLVKANNVKVKDVVEYLNKLNPEASISCCGSDLFYFHSSTDGNIVTVDHELLEDAYEKDFCEIFETVADIPNIN